MIHMPYRPYVHMRLASVKPLFAHLCLSLHSRILSTQIKESYKPKTGIEPVTSSLPRMRSTPELLGHLRKVWSGRRDSNSRPSAWKADALPTELLPLINLVQGVGFEPT